MCVTVFAGTLSQSTTFHEHVREHANKWQTGDEQFANTTVEAHRENNFRNVADKDRFLGKSS